MGALDLSPEQIAGAFAAMDGLPSAERARAEAARAIALGTVEIAIEELAQLSELEYELGRAEVATKFHLRASVLDRLVRAKRAQPAQPNGNGGSAANGSAHAAQTHVEPAVHQITALYESAKSIIEHGDPLVLIDEQIARLGYAGDRRPATLVYVGIASRYLEHPINMFIEAQSAAGKNYTADTAVRLHPSDAVYRVDASSPRALVYSDESFEHRFVYLSEGDSIPSEGPAASAIRALVHDNSMHYAVVEKDPDTNRYVTREICKPGPTGLLSTGVRGLEFQMGTRCLTLALSDDPEQNRAVLLAEAEAANRAIEESDEGLTRFVDYQRWLGLAGERRVAIPFARALAQLIPATAVRVRRDFKQLLSVIKTCAFLSQQKRGRTEAGWIEASMRDYARARDLLAPILDSLMADAVTPPIRATVEAIKEGEEISQPELARRLGVAKSTAQYRMRAAIRGGWLVNNEIRTRHPARIARGNALPEPSSALPSVAQLTREFEASINNLVDEGEADEI